MDNPSPRFSPTADGPQQSANLGNALARRLRLQALFPSTQNTTTPNVLNDSPISSQRMQSLPPKFLKVRIVTWNMHDSLPKGDLTELLGEVPVYTPEWPDNPPPTSVPSLPVDGKHPYHLVVVASQECPTSSGIPMGLGAGFRPKDKEKEPAPLIDPAPDLASIPYGWTAILEDWLSHAGGSNLGPSYITENEPRKTNGESQSPVLPNLKRRMFTRATVSQKGPYEILIKERMMGLYLAVYIHREIKHLVQGVSKSSVTAGLIGGRVGNKGGLGISVNLDGTTLLFVNAHLAAHEGKVQHRLNDLAKIKGELAVDDFLANDDPRLTGEDLTDRFDFTFLFGDLNFRLDISRLHADWLISRRNYAQALGFDQLRNLMQHGDAFVGFNEADIYFPPTFKYDVMRTLKRLKSKPARSTKLDSELAEDPLMEEPEVRVDDVDAVDCYGDEDAGSLVSSNATSISYRLLLEREPVEDDYLSRAHVLPASTGNLVQKVKTMAAARKSRTKWLNRFSVVPPSPFPNNKSISSPILSHSNSKWSDKLRKSSLEELSELKSPALSSRIASTPPTLDNSSTKSSNISKGVDQSLLGPPLSRTDPTKSTSDEQVDGHRGVYDSSSKKRVPSWCDRILWKSTVEPNSDSDDDESEAPHPKARTRVGQFFANFRMRYRKGSCNSPTSLEVSSYGHAPPVLSRDKVPIPSRSLPSPLISAVVGGEGLRQFSRFATPEDTAVGFDSSAFVDNVRRIPGAGLPRSFSVDQTQPGRKSHSKHRRFSHTETSPMKPPSATPQPTESAPITITPMDEQAARWRFFPFFRRDSGQAAVPTDPSLNHGESTEVTTGPTTSKPRKGDVICLGYDSLDDKAMRRLEGRSDHRPVIGSFAIYL